MANFTALKTAIQNAIKQNGNEEITGNLLQEVLLAIVTTLGDGSINDLITALGTEATTRGNADTTLQQNIDAEAQARNQADATLQQNIDAEATTRGQADTALQQNINAEAQARSNADTALGGRIDGVIESINAINAAIGNGYVYAGLATPSSTPTTGKVFYLALTAGTYTNFNSLVVPQGINILKNNGSTWLLDSFLIIDDAPTPSSNNLVKSGGVFNDIMTNGSAFDLTAYNNGTTYADLNAALTALNALPADFKKGGMSMKYVQSSDNNYVQFRFMLSGSFTTAQFTNPDNWQGVDNTPVENSQNLIKSGGVFEGDNALKSTIRLLAHYPFNTINIPAAGGQFIVAKNLYLIGGKSYQIEVISTNMTPSSSTTYYWGYRTGGTYVNVGQFSGTVNKKYLNWNPQTDLDNVDLYITFPALTSDKDMYVIIHDLSNSLLVAYYSQLDKSDAQKLRARQNIGLPDGIDTVPTKNSGNLITSNAVYEAVAPIPLLDWNLNMDSLPNIDTTAHTFTLGTNCVLRLRGTRYSLNDNLSCAYKDTDSSNHIIIINISSKTMYAKQYDYAISENEIIIGSIHTTYGGYGLRGISFPFKVMINGYEWYKSTGANINTIDMQSLAVFMRESYPNPNFKNRTYYQRMLAQSIGFSRAKDIETQGYIPQLSFIHMSDVHGGKDNTDNAVTLLNLLSTDSINEGNSVQFLINTGDIHNHDFTSEYTWTTKVASANKPCFICIGNHDAGNTDVIANCGDDSQIYTEMVAPLIDSWDLMTTHQGTPHPTGKNYYFKDFDTFKVRMIVLYEYESEFDVVNPSDSTKYTIKRGNRAIGQTQIDWLLDSLYTTPDGWGVIIAKHSIENYTGLLDNPFNSIYSRGEGNDTIVSAGTLNMIADIVQAFIDKTSINHSYTYNQGGKTIIVNVVKDFYGLDANTEFVCYLSGHTHNDRVSYLKDYPKQLELNICCDQYFYTNTCDMARKNAMLTMDALNVVSIDRNRGYVNIVRVGATMTNYGVERKCTTINYRV